ncbi:MAG: hypothetical protein AAB953_01010, partial [Patescibacteria group bacterium]
MSKTVKIVIAIALVAIIVLGGLYFAKPEIFQGRLQLASCPPPGKKIVSIVTSSVPSKVTSKVTSKGGTSKVTSIVTS